MALTYGFSNSAGQIWLSNVQCLGTETTLASCPHSGFGVHNCRHYEDAGVRCQPIQGQSALIDIWYGQDYFM